MKVIGIIGSRRRNEMKDRVALRKVFEGISDEDDTIVSGGCPEGGDRFAEEIAKTDGRTITIHYPAWKRHGKAAGFVRNKQIAEDCDILIALVAPDRTGGTEDTIKKANALRKPVVIVE